MLFSTLGWWSSSASSYPAPVDFDGSLLRWPIEEMGTPIFFEVEADIDEDLEEFGSLVEEAATLWSHAVGSAASYEKAPAETSAHVTVKLVRSLKDGAYASGYTTFDEWEGSRPLHCSIYIHISDAYSYNGIAKTILHEMGHGLGLGHTLVPEAIMSYSLDKNQFAIDVDDAAAVARLYPTDGTKPRLPPGCAVGSRTGFTVPRKGLQAPRELGSILLILMPFLTFFGSLQPMASMRSIERFARRRMSSGT